LNLYQELFEVSRLLLSEGETERAGEALVQRVVEACGAEAGFLVVREDGSYQPRFEVGRSGLSRSSEERGFCSALVREAISSGAPLDLPNLIDDPRFAGAESARLIGVCSVLVVPLRYAGEVYGVLYLEDRRQTGAFGEESRRFLTACAELGALFLRRAAERRRLQLRTQSLERDLFARHRFPGIVTQDPRLVALLEMVAQIAPADAPVLVFGETGTGKELIARALHLNGPRAPEPLVTVHCAALPATLLEAELFGHAAGAFTDARRERQGRLSAAHRGTLFLDEVGEIPLEAQAKLLRFLQFGEVQKVGSDRVEKVDVRIVAATHRDLKRLVREGSFREDLYFRLHVLDLTLPPLRERRGDVPLLLDHFLRRHWRRPKETPRWTARAERVLLAHDYPGNVREIAHLVERACILARGPLLDVDLLPRELAAQAGGAEAEESEGEEAALPALTGEALAEAREALVARLERRFLTDLMRRCEGNVSRAAREAGMRRSYLQKLLARHRQDSGDEV